MAQKVANIVWDAVEVAYIIKFFQFDDIICTFTVGFIDSKDEYNIATVFKKETYAAGITDNEKTLYRERAKQLAILFES